MAHVSCVVEGEDGDLVDGREVADGFDGFASRSVVGEVVFPGEVDERVKDDELGFDRNGGFVDFSVEELVVDGDSGVAGVDRQGAVGGDAVFGEGWEGVGAIGVGDLVEEASTFGVGFFAGEPEDGALNGGAAEEGLAGGDGDGEGGGEDGFADFGRASEDGGAGDGQKVIDEPVFGVRIAFGVVIDEVERLRGHTSLLLGGKFVNWVVKW